MYANAYLVYESVPMFQDKRLHEAYEVKEPVQIVEKLLLPVEIKEVAEKAMELAGFTKKDPIESVKK
jgi:Phage XkdN-like tail assembly chaperone protein, TAC